MDLVAYIATMPRQECDAITSGCGGKRVLDSKYGPTETADTVTSAPAETTYLAD